MRDAGLSGIGIVGGSAVLAACGTDGAATTTYKKQLLRIQTEPEGADWHDEVDRIEDETEALLLEILSDSQVSVPELGTISASTQPLLTSNNSRDLSEALKRRCVYLDIDHPTVAREQAMIKARIPGITSALAANCAQVVSWVRSFELKKPPSVPETLDWARTLMVLGRTAVSTDDTRASLNLLVNYSQDIDKITESLKAV